MREWWKTLSVQWAPGPAWTLILIGVVIAGIGFVWLLVPSIPWLGKLPGDKGAHSTTQQHGCDVEPRANTVRIESSLKAFNRAIDHAAIKAKQKAPNRCNHTQPEDC